MGRGSRPACLTATAPGSIATDPLHRSPQAVALNFFPRVTIRHTEATHQGQVGDGQLRLTLEPWPGPRSALLHAVRAGG